MSEPAGAETPAGSILARTARGAGWVIGWRMTTRLIGMASTLILARLLVPADFGLVALASIFAAAIDSISQVGVEQALIRAPKASRELYNTGFTLNLMRGFATGLIVALAAEPLSRFYGDPRLAALLFVLAGAAAADGFENIGIVDFRRDLTFDKEFRLLVFPRLLAVVVTVSAALVWHSYWALMAGILVGRIFLLVQGYIMHPFRPRLGLSAWREIAGYSFWTWLMGLVSMVHDRIGNLTIGRVVGPTFFGVYMIGSELAYLPGSELILPLTRACFPGFAAVQQEGGNSAKAFLRIVGAMLLLSLPAGIGLAMVASPLVRLACGAQWMAAVPVLRILAVMAMGSVFAGIGSAMLSAHAHLRPIFLISLGSLVVKLPLIVFLGMRYGIVGVATATGVGNVIDTIANTRVVMRRYGLTIADLGRTSWRPVLATAAMAAVLGLTGLGWSAPPEAAGRLAVSLFTAVGVGVAIYVAALALLWAASGLPAGAEADFLGLIRQILGQARGRLSRRRSSGQAAAGE